MKKYLNNNSSFKLGEGDSRKNLVFVQFAAQLDGSISEVEIIKGITSEFTKEAIRIVSEMPKWVPGKWYDEDIIVTMVQPINFSSERSKIGDDK